MRAPDGLRILAIGRHVGVMKREGGALNGWSSCAAVEEYPMRWWRILLLPATLFVACDDDPAGPGAQPFEGAWVWVASVGGFAGVTHTPAIDGISVRLDFAGGRVRGYRDGVLVAEATYTATELPTSGPLPSYEIRYQPPLAVLPFDVFDEHLLHWIAPSVVEFEDPCCDRYDHTFADTAIK
jgi:hypothetical protein